MQLVIITGLSGSGKSVALKALEDATYYTADNLPAKLLPAMVDFLREAGYARVAVSIDARNIPGSLARFPEIIASLSPAFAVDVIYLDADDATLIKRFSETRRRHPLSNAGMPLAEALAAERALLAPIAERAARTIDTRGMSLHDLRDLITKTVLAQPASGMAVLFESFGFKSGIPLDADLVFDLRSLPNPHWFPELRHLTGRDAPVAEFLAASAEVDEMLADIGSFLARWLPRYAASNRSYTTVAIGCTGGRHRSVYAAERLLERFAPQFPGARLRHRELGPE